MGHALHGQVAKTIAGVVKASKAVEKDISLESLTPRELEIAKLVVGEGAMR